MRILTLGDSWTFGKDTAESWPTQMAKNYSVEVVNLARPGSSNRRAARIGIEEIARNPNYDYIIFPLAPASRTETLDHGKWRQIWPTKILSEPDELNSIFTKLWHPWNDIQSIILECFYFIHAVKALNIPLYLTGLSLQPSKYINELSWVLNYQHNKDFAALGMPLDEFNIGVNDLDRKLKSLQAIHNLNVASQPDYLTDVIETYYDTELIKTKYNYQYTGHGEHPTTNGHLALCEYFAKKINLH